MAELLQAHGLRFAPEEMAYFSSETLPEVLGRATQTCFVFSLLLSLSHIISYVYVMTVNYIKYYD